jgi:DNA repair protein RecO (recombination protein O)
MGLTETEAIVLRTYNLAEADKIVVCLTRSSGVVRAVARGARRLKSRFGAGLEPFTIIALAYYEKEGRELVSVRQAEIIRSFFSLAQNTETVAALAYMSELVMEFAPPHEPNEKIFRMFRAVLEALAASPEGLSSLVRYFEIWMLKLGGFLPDLRSCAECGRKFDEASAGYLNAEFKLRCGPCSQRSGTALSPMAHAQLRSAQRLSPSDFAEATRDLAVAQRGEVTNLTQGLIGRALERQPRSQASFN